MGLEPLFPRLRQKSGADLWEFQKGRWNFFEFSENYQIYFSPGI